MKLKKLHLRDKAWITIPEAMRYMRKPRTYIMQMIKDGTLNAVNDGGSDEHPKIKVSTAAIERWIEQEAERLRKLLNEGEDSAA